MNIKHSNNLFPTRKVPRGVLGEWCINVAVISCMYFGINLKAGWMEFG